MVFSIACGAYLRAKNGARLLASKHLWRSCGVVASIEAGPSKPLEQTQTSILPYALSASSIRTRVSCSLEIVYG